MSERRVKLPEAAERFVVDVFSELNQPVALMGARRLAAWIVANPQVPTIQQANAILDGGNWRIMSTDPQQFARACSEFQRRFLFAPAEPEDPLADLLADPEYKGKLLPIYAERHDWELREAYKRGVQDGFERGQQSMIRKDG